MKGCPLPVTRYPQKAEFFSPTSWGSTRATGSSSLPLGGRGVCLSDQTRVLSHRLLVVAASGGGNHRFSPRRGESAEGGRGVPACRP